MAPVAADPVIEPFGMKGMQVGILGAAETALETIAVAFVGIGRVVGIVMAAKTQRIVAGAAGTRTGGVAPDALQYEVLGRAVRPPGIIAAGHHGAHGGERAVAVGTVHGLVADIGGAVPGGKKQVGAVGGVGHGADRRSAPGIVHHRVPGSIGDCPVFLCQRRLELHGLVGVLVEIIGSNRGLAAGAVRHRPVAGRIDPVIVVAVIGMAFETHLVFPCDPGTADSSGCADPAVTLFHRSHAKDRQAEKSGRGVTCGFHTPGAPEHAGSDIGMEIAINMFMRAFGVIRGCDAGPVEKSILNHAVRVVAIRAFDMAVIEVAYAQQKLGFAEISIGDVV